MLVLESLPTVIGTAAVAPALLMLWLVVAAGERPGPPTRVWTAFLLGAASISLLGVVRAPILSILPAPGNPWLAQAMHSLFGVALPEETVKLLVIVAVSARRRPFADPMDTVVYGAAAGLGFAAYENLAYLVLHADMWQSLAALRSVLTVPFHGALGIIAGAYLAIARSGTALGAHRRHRDWARISSRVLVLAGPVALHAAFDFPLLTLQRHPDIDPTARLLLGSASVLVGFSSIGFAVRAYAARQPPSCAANRCRPSTVKSASANVGAFGGRRRCRICRCGLRTDLDPPLALESRSQHGVRSRPARPRLHRCRYRAAGRHYRGLRPGPRSHAHEFAGFFVSTRSRVEIPGGKSGAVRVPKKFAPITGRPRCVIFLPS